MNLRKIKTENKDFEAAMNAARNAFNDLDNRGRRKVFRRLDKEFRPAKSTSMYKFYYNNWERHVMNLPEDSRIFTVAAMLKCIQEAFVEIVAETESDLAQLNEILPVAKAHLNAMNCFENLNA